ncbi:hypothetical protein DJ73_02135 [Halorubrum sp. Ea1]|nr:hypothetical protein DJ73_02135 [Halorubrum sp. Ea1]
MFRTSTTRSFIGIVAVAFALSPAHVFETVVVWLHVVSSILAEVVVSAACEYSNPTSDAGPFVGEFVEMLTRLVPSLSHNGLAWSDTVSPADSVPACPAVSPLTSTTGSRVSVTSVHDAATSTGPLTDISPDCEPVERSTDSVTVSPSPSVPE